MNNLRGAPKKDDDLKRVAINVGVPKWLKDESLKYKALGYDVDFSKIMKSELIKLVEIYRKAEGK